MGWGIAVYVLGAFGSAYAIPRMMGEAGQAIFAPVWPIILPVIIGMKLAELGEKHSRERR